MYKMNVCYLSKEEIEEERSLKQQPSMRGDTPQVIDTSKLTRLTVVYNGERIIERWNSKIEISVQDEGRTLKIFYDDKPRDDK